MNKNNFNWRDEKNIVVCVPSAIVEIKTKMQPFESSCVIHLGFKIGLNNLTGCCSASKNDLSCSSGRRLSCLLKSNAKSLQHTCIHEKLLCQLPTGSDACATYYSRANGIHEIHQSYQNDMGVPKSGNRL